MHLSQTRRNDRKLVILKLESWKVEKFVGETQRILTFFFTRNVFMAKNIYQNFGNSSGAYVQLGSLPVEILNCSFQIVQKFFCRIRIRRKFVHNFSNFANRSILAFLTRHPHIEGHQCWKWPFDDGHLIF